MTAASPSFAKEATLKVDNRFELPIDFNASIIEIIGSFFLSLRP
jgi:hypothetical protein